MSGTLWLRIRDKVCNLCFFVCDDFVQQHSCCYARMIIILLSSSICWTILFICSEVSR